MPNELREDGSLYTDYGQKLRGPNMDFKDIIQRLSVMDGSKTAKDAIQWMERVNRLLLPVYMTIIEQTMANQPLPDESVLFNFIGSGGSDFTFTAEYRALFGDERQDLLRMDEAYNEELEAAKRGECTNLSGCQQPDIHNGSCGYSVPVELTDDLDFESLPRSSISDVDQTRLEGDQSGSSDQSNGDTKNLHETGD